VTAISANDLARFDPVSELDADQIATLAVEAHVESVNRGTVLMERGSSDNWTVYLLEGSLALEAADRGVLKIEANSPRALSPVARLQPRQYRVIAQVPSTIVRIASDKIDAMFKSKRQAAYNVTEDISPSSAEFAYVLHTQLSRDVDEDKVVLPSLPQIGATIRDELRNRTVNVGSIARLIQTDPPMAAKMIKLANSSSYGATAELRTCHAATTRVGSENAVRYLTDVAAEEIFHGNGLMHGWMRNLWEHSVCVAAFSLVIARAVPMLIEPEQAWLAGLVHDIGTFAVLHYANRYSRQIQSTDDLNEIITQMRGTIGAKILQRWQFPPELALVASECEQWERDPNPDPDLCDLVLIAQLHSFLLSSRRMSNLPMMRKLPAFSKLGLDKVAPSVGPKIVSEAKDLVAQAKTRFGL
jgi:HD-like signal output (HDOD) protein